MSYAFVLPVLCIVPWTGLAGLTAIPFSKNCKVSEVTFIE